MKDRMKKAVEEYDRKNWGPTEAAFYPSDLAEIQDISPGGGVLFNRQRIKSGLYDRVQEGETGRTQESAEGLTATDFINLFEMLVELTGQRIINPKRYEKQFIEWTGCTETSPLYYMGIGFLGALDTIAELEKCMSFLEAELKAKHLNEE